MKLHSRFARMGKRLAIAASFGVLCFVVGAPSAQAEDRNSCQVRVERAEYRLNDAIRDHGYYSHQANDRRRDLNRERERCWSQMRYRGDRDDRWQNGRNRDRDDRNLNRDRDDHPRERDDGNRDRDHYNHDSR